MTRADITNLAQVLQPLVKDGKLSEEDAHQLLDRMLWAIHASHNSAKFDEQKFRDFALGKFGRVASEMFPFKP